MSITDSINRLILSLFGKTLSALKEGCPTHTNRLGVSGDKNGLLWYQWYIDDFRVILTMSILCKPTFREDCVK